jgi:hypothetical protein
MARARPPTCSWRRRARRAPGAGQFFAGGRSREQLDRLERELHNIRAALDALVRVAPARAVALAVDLTGRWETRHVAEGRRWVACALGAGGDDLAPATRASGLWTAAILAHYQGDDAAERPLAVAALAAARAAGDTLTLARALYVEAMSIATDVPAAAARYREVLALCEELGDDAGVAMACNDLGELARSEGELDEAIALYERALELWRAGGDPSGVARAAHNLGQTMLARGELDRAGALLLEALGASSGIGDRNQDATALAGLAAVAAAPRRARPPPRCTARRRRSSTRPTSRWRVSTRRRSALRRTRWARRWARSASPRPARAVARWAMTSAGASSSAKWPARRSRRPMCSPGASWSSSA